MTADCHALVQHFQLKIWKRQCGSAGQLPIFYHGLVNHEWSRNHSYSARQCSSSFLLLLKIEIKVSSLKEARILRQKSYSTSWSTEIKWKSMHTEVLVIEKQVYSARLFFCSIFAWNMLVLNLCFVFKIFGLHKTHILGLGWVASYSSFYFLLLTLQVVLVSLLGHMNLLEHWKVNWALIVRRALKDLDAYVAAIFIRNNSKA